MKNCDKCTYEGCCGLDKKIMQTNSYIEELFYRKCMEKNVRNKLLLEWIDSKTIYMSYTDFTKSDMGNYSRHDATHSIAILNAIESVLGKEKIKECYYSVAFTEKGAQHVMNLHNGWQEKIEHFNEYAYMEIEKMDTIDSMPVSLDKNGNFVNKN